MQVCYYFIQITHISLAIFTGVTVTKARRHSPLATQSLVTHKPLKIPKLSLNNSKCVKYQEPSVVTEERGGKKRMKWQLHQVGLRNLYPKGL